MPNLFLYHLGDIRSCSDTDTASSIHVKKCPMEQAKISPENSKRPRESDTPEVNNQKESLYPSILGFWRQQGNLDFDILQTTAKSNLKSLWMSTKFWYYVAFRTQTQSREQTASKTNEQDKLHTVQPFLRSLATTRLDTNSQSTNWWQ